MITLSDLKVDRQILEARFPLNFRFWDRAGMLWTEVARSNPELRFVLADANHTQFEAGDFLFAVELGAIRLTSKDAVPFEQFEKMAKVFYGIVVDLLEIEMFDRLGFRTVWSKEFPSMTDAAKAFQDFRLLSEPKGTAFGIKEPPAQLEMRMTWEGELFGTILGLRTEKRRVEPQIPWDIRSQLKATPSERCLLVMDLDYFTKATLSKGKVDIGEWLHSAQRTVNKALKNEVFK